MTALGHCLDNSVSNVLKCYTWLLGVISFTTPYQNQWHVIYGCNGLFPLEFLIKSTKYENSVLRAISFTIPYQHHWNMTYDCYGQFPLQFLNKVIEIWHLAARDNFHYNSLSKSMISDLQLLWAISYTIPYLNHWNIT